MPWEEVGKLLTVLFTGLGGGVLGKWLLDVWREWRRGKGIDRTVARRERADALEELTAIIDTLRRDLAKTDAKAEAALTNERECEKKWIRALSYIEYIVFEAQVRGWDIRPWKEHGTDLAVPALPQGVIEDRRKKDDPRRRGPERRRKRDGEVDLHGPDEPPPPSGDDEGSDSEG